MTLVKVKTEKTVKTSLAENVKEESQVIVHCKFTATEDTSLIRIWNSTFLFPKGSNRRSKLVHTENITLYPVWTPVEKGHTLNFTLIFTALPKNCDFFDLVEEIPQSGGFSVTNIKRNKSDVYTVDLSN